MPEGINLGSDSFQSFLKTTGVGDADKRVEAAAADNAAKRKETVAKVHSLADEQYALKPPDLPDLPPPPEAQSRDFTQAFGSAAGWLAVFGGLLTKKPLQASLTAATEVIKAYQSQDAAAAQGAYDRWKISTDRALQLYDFQNKTYDRAMKRLDTDRDNALVELQTTAMAFQDETALHHLRVGDVDSFVRLQEARLSMSTKLEDAKLKGEEAKLKRDEFMVKYGPAMDFAKSPQGQALKASDPETYAQKMQQLVQPSVASTIIRDQTARDLGNRKLDVQQDTLDLKRELGERALDQGDEKIAETKWYQQQRVALMKEGRSDKEADRLLKEHIAEMRDKTTRRGQDMVGGKATAKVDEQVKELSTLQKDTQDALAMLEADPSLVGLKGKLRRGAQSVLGQTGEAATEDRAVEEFRAKIVALRARMAKAVLNARYFSGPAQKVASDMLPGLEAMDDPVKVRSSLQRLSEILDDKVTTLRGAAEDVNSNLKELSDEEIMRSLGLPH